jgi:hypothetical protein
MTSDSASRVTRSSRSLRRTLALLAACIAVVGLLRAQETAAPPGSARTTADSPESAKEKQSAPATQSAAPAGADSGTSDAVASAPGTDSEGTADSTTEKPSPADVRPAPAKGGTSPGRFEPTEKVRADFDVSFPVDI